MKIGHKIGVLSRFFYTWHLGAAWQVDPGAADVDLSESATVSGHAPAPTPVPRSRDSKEAEMEEHEEPVAKRPRLSTSRRSLGSECGVRLVIHRWEHFVCLVAICV